MVHYNPNLVAYFALLIWPAVALYLYSRLSVAQATVWTILGAYLLLPVGTEIKFDMVPVFDKHSISSLAALIGCVLFASRFPKFFYGFGVAEALIFFAIAGPFVTSALNGDPVQWGSRIIPGVGQYDGLSAAVAQLIRLLPFFLGRQFLRSAEDNSLILRALAIAGIAYSIPMLFEIRMSPQLHIWIYGYFPHTDFSQQYRDGSFRPVVFIGHGLLLAFFAMTTTVAAAALWRTKTRINRFSPGTIVAYLSFVLVLCKTMSAIVYAAVLVPLVRWAQPRLQLRVANILVILALSYPMLRVADLIPTTSILQAASVVSSARTASLETRFKQEQKLLRRAWHRPWFGWGRYSRNRVFSPDGGQDVTITDGYWINIIGTFGLVGFIAEFGLLAFTVFRASTALRFTRTMQEQIHFAALALIVAVNIFDLLPNSSLTPWTWLLAGALLGRAEVLSAVARQRLPLSTLQLSPLEVKQAANSSTEPTVHIT